MGCGIKAMHDDWDDYVNLCRKHGVNPTGDMYGGYQDHERELLAKDDPDAFYKKRDDHNLGYN